MRNYIYDEDFELRDGVYISEKRIMGKNFLIERVGLGKSIGELVLKNGVEWLFNYFGINPRYTSIKINGNGISTGSYSEPSFWEFGNVNLYERIWKFMEHATLLESSSYYTTYIRYREVWDDFELEIENVNARYFGDEFIWLLGKGKTVEYFRKLMEWDGFLKISFDKTWGDYVLGGIEYVGKNKEFKGSITADFEKNALIIKEVPFVEGVYRLKIPSGKKANLDSLSVKNVGKGVKKNILLGLGARRVNDLQIKKIKNNLLVGENFEIEYDEDEFAVYTYGSVKWFDYDDWEFVHEVLKKNKPGMLELLR